MNKIQIALDEVETCAKRIGSLNQEMYENLNAMKRNINALDGTWMSDGGRAIRNKFNRFAQRFEKQKEVIDAYVQFLHLTISSYDTLENTIQTNATSMQE